MYREAFEEADGNVATAGRRPVRGEPKRRKNNAPGEAHRFADEATSLVDAHLVSSPVLETVVAELADHVETLRRRMEVSPEEETERKRRERTNLARRNVPVPTLLDLGKDPGLDQSTASKHDAVDLACLHIVPVSAVVVRVSVAEDRNRLETILGGGVAEDLGAVTDVCGKGRRISTE